MPTTLFDPFAPVSLEEWVEKIKIDLKGKPLSSLETLPEPDLKIRAYHHGDDISSKTNGEKTVLQKEHNDWFVREAFSAELHHNKNVLDALNNGVNSLGIHWSNQSAFDRLTEAVLFDHIQSDIHFENLGEAVKASIPSNSQAVFDPIAINAMAGSNKYLPADFSTFYASNLPNKTIWASGYTYGNAGASTIQELAFTLAHLNEYLHELTSKGAKIEDLTPKIRVELAVNENYLINIAKFRVIQDLFRLLLEGYEYNGQAATVKVFARTTSRHLALNDAHNNSLRQTTQAMSAVIGGCDTLTITTRKTGNKGVDRRLKRLSRNIQLILKEESHFNKVADPASGAYYIEAICADLMEKSWALFLEIEDGGGLIAGLESNKIQDLIEDNKTTLINWMNTGERTFLGVNKHPNSSEEWVSPEKRPEKTDAFKAIQPFELENYFEQNTHHE